MSRGLITMLFLLHWLVIPLAGAGAHLSGAHALAGHDTVATTHAAQSSAAASTHHGPPAHDETSCCDVAGHCASAVVPAVVRVAGAAPQPIFVHAAPERLSPGVAAPPYRPPSLSS